MILLRPKQAVFMDDLRIAFRTYARVLGVGPTGFGKTVVFSAIAHGAASKGNNVLIGAHRVELLDQISEALAQANTPHGFIAADYEYKPQQTMVASIQTLVRRLDKIRPPQLIIIDEAHHAMAQTYRRILSQWPQAKVLGVTATPIRTSGAGLGDLFHTMVVGPTIPELIEDGHLSPFRVFAPPTMDTSGLHMRAGDYVPSEIEALANKPSVTGSALNEYRKLSDGKRALAFCTSVEHAHSVANEFREAGYAALALDGGTDRGIRRQAVADFKRGAIQIMASCDLFSEGFDCGGVECGIFLRPTASLGLYQQQVGRCLRIAEGKSHAVLLDHAGNCVRFGLPDTPRDWSLKGEGPEKGAKREVSCRICPSCWAANKTAARACANCGHPFPVKSREVEQREGELVELTAESIAKKRERRDQGMAQSLEALIRIEKRKKYRPGWALKVFNAREAKKARKANDDLATRSGVLI